MKIRRRLLIIAALAVLCLDAVLFAHYFTGPKETDKSIGELAATQGQIASYSFLDDSRGTHQYTIRLSEYPATFQIPADFAPYFAKSRFESDLKKGDPISLSIPSASAGKLITDATIPVFAVHAGTESYLDEHTTVEAYNKKNNPQPVPAQTSWVPLIIASSIILLFALIYVIWKIARVISARSRARENVLNPAALDESSQRLKKILTKGAPEQKSPAIGDAEQELLATGNSEQKPDDPPQA